MGGKINAELFIFIAVLLVASVTGNMVYSSIVTTSFKDNLTYSFQTPDSVINDVELSNVIQLTDIIYIDSLKILDDDMKSVRRLPKEIVNRSAFDFLQLSSSKIVSWKFDKTFLSNNEIETDTLLWMNHLFYPQQRKFESFTSLGNFGSPTQYDHFFSRQLNSSFIFSQYLDVYAPSILEQIQYNVRSPFTLLTYSSAGKRSEAEQVFRVLHTQNLGKHFNFGVTYDFYGTKGVYENQETRNNLISSFASYYKGNVFFQVSLKNKVFRHQENGGIKDHYFIQDTLMEAKLIPIWLNGAKSLTREQSFSLVAGYTLLNYKKRLVDSTQKSIDVYIPLMSLRAVVNHGRFSRHFSNSTNISSYFSNSYFSPNVTNDSVSRRQWEVLGIFEVAQFARVPGMPGLRAWVGVDHFNNYSINPTDFIFNHVNDTYFSSHIGVGVFSESDYLSYQGALRFYYSGYNTDDKEVAGEVKLSIWKNKDMPHIKGSVLVNESTPDMFLTKYYSNHFVWNNKFNKEKKFLLKGAFEAPKWEAEFGYNLIHIRDFLYFNTEALPSQAFDVTITSAYAQKNLKFFGVNFFNKVVWQASTNSNVLSLPQLITFSALFYERELVKNVLVGQIGFNILFRSSFYADAYQPAIGQFYNQRNKLLGGYPTLDLFANFKWKKVLIFVKYEHANQGYPDSQYFAAYSHPMNPQIFKFGLSWIFYD